MHEACICLLSSDCHFVAACVCTHGVAIKAMDLEVHKATVSHTMNKHDL